MTELIKAMQVVDGATQELFNLILRQFEQDDTDYLVTFKGKTYDISKPITKEDKVEHDKLKHYVAYLLLYDSFSRLCKRLKKPNRVPHDDDFRKVWINIANLYRYTSRQESTSTLVSNEEYIVDEGTSKPLDLESIYVQSQRSDLSDEERINILVGCLQIKDIDKPGGTSNSDKE